MNAEKALFVESTEALKKASLQGFERIYFGHETCERRLPTLSEFNQAKKLCEKHSLAFSLMSPFCTNSGIKKLLPLIKKLGRSDELIANDFGVLYLASKKCRAEIVAGRLLNRQYRDPRIALFKNAPKEMQQHLRSSQASSELFRAMLQQFNVQRVELDNLLQGIETNLSNSGLRASLYHPLVFIAATRFCLAANCDKLSHAKKVGVFPCGKECLQYSFKLENKEFKKPLYLFGNALYFENKKIPKLAGKGINRLVFTAKTLPQEE